jgi:uncharacterized membrane protein YoaK (UPF0700 family)
MTARPRGAETLRRAVLFDPEHGRLPALLLALTLLSGFVDATTVLSLGHVFVANMTGNLVFIGFGLAQTVGFSLVTSLIAFGGFIVGIEACRRWARVRPQRLLLLRDVLIGQAVLLAAAAVACGAAGGSPTGATRYAVVAIAAAAMGGQNAAARRMGVTELTTSVMTGTVVTLISNLDRPGAAELRQAFGVVVLVAGAAIGAAALRASDSAVTLSICVVIATAVAVGAARECRRVGGAA